MFSFFKKKDQKKQTEQKANPLYDFKWYDLGEGNPFNKRILDIRSFTQQMTSTTQNRNVAELFLKNRAGIGQEYIGFRFKNCISIDTELIYRHNGEKVEGSGYKAKVMEDKWDIYAWNDIIYFVRSWTGDVGYKAFITYNHQSFTVYKIEFEGQNAAQSEQSLVINNIHFLLSTLAFKAVQPHKIPGHLITHEEIAAYSFALFGRNCWYATYDDITDITMVITDN
ncbi:hypothetical protein ACPPVU_24720 [Mucilaginibacter sp. McL0603]|uniref:hypothetical protein n=1 Tax=Mucilaginibacter sp. McL0603 TaxID=3415670 RepID=UPI003CEB1DBB